MGLSCQDVGRAIDRSERAIQRYENGTYTPGVFVLGQLATLYETTVDELLNGDSDNDEAAA